MVMKARNYSTGQGKVIFAMPAIASIPWLAVMVVKNFFNSDFQWPPIMLLALALLLLWRGLTTCVVVHDGMLKSRGVFKTTTIPLKEIDMAKMDVDGSMVLLLRNGERLPCKQIYGKNTAIIIEAVNVHVEGAGNAES